VLAAAEAHFQPNFGDVTGKIAAGIATRFRCELKAGEQRFEQFRLMGGKRGPLAPAEMAPLAKSILEGRVFHAASRRPIRMRL
jgi:hypothetical protein